MSNKSITFYTDKVTIDEILATLKTLTEKEVILNGTAWYDDVYERDCQVVTFLDLDTKEFNKIRNRAAFKKTLKSSVKTFTRASDS